MVPNYEMIMTEEEISQYPNPHEALKDLNKKLAQKIVDDNNYYYNYIFHTTNEGKSLKMTATYSEERKKHFEDNPI